MIHFSKPCDHLRFVAALLAGSWFIAWPAMAQKVKTVAEPIVIDSVTSTLDDGAKTADFTAVSVTQGKKKLTAERASVTGVGSQNSRWSFAGRVTITSKSGNTLWADQATLEYRDGELFQATATGSPVRFEQRPAGSEPAQHGQADVLTYDPKQGTVHLRGHATLTNGSMDVSAPLFVYRVKEDKWQAYSENGTKAVHIVTGPAKPIVDVPRQDPIPCPREPCK